MNNKTVSSFLVQFDQNHLTTYTLENMSLIKSKEFSLISKDNDEFIIRSISLQDIELLRTWKNDHRDSFFFKEIITPEMQKNWFLSYLQRRNDFMMIIIKSNEKIGCIGFRLLIDKVDIYNVILGRKKYAKEDICLVH